MYIRPLFAVCPAVPAPMAETTEATAGSCCTTLFAACCNAAIWVKDVSCAASVMPMMMPVSWVGKKPLGMITYSTTVSATVAMNTISVMNWNRSATSSVRW